MSEIEENRQKCDELLDTLAKLSDSDTNDTATWLLIGDSETNIMELKTLYAQIIKDI